MPLTELEKSILDKLVDAERARRRNDQPTAFWLIDSIVDGVVKAEALRLVHEAKVFKQAEVDAWPAQAQDRLTQLQGELANLTSLETKLTP